jgi:hypothetical protein
MGWDGRFQKGHDPRRNPTGGKPGPRKATVERNRREAEEAEERRKREAEFESNLSPLDFMLRRMRDTGMSEPERFAAARSAAQYMHPQLQAIAHQHLDNAGNPVAPTVTVTIQRAAPKPELPKLTHIGPKKTDSVQ